MENNKQKNTIIAIEEAKTKIANCINEQLLSLNVGVVALILNDINNNIKNQKNQILLKELSENEKNKKDN